MEQVRDFNDFNINDTSMVITGKINLKEKDVKDIIARYFKVSSDKINLYAQLPNNTTTYASVEISANYSWQSSPALIYPPNVRN